VRLRANAPKAACPLNANVSDMATRKKLATLLVSRSALREYQDVLVRKLSRVFREVPVQSEWATMTDESGLYSPRLDVAVGPFATDRIYIGEYDALIRTHAPLVKALFTVHRANLKEHGERDDHFSFDELCHRNSNSRCFLAFEIENAVSRKHLMGGAINAAALGRIGIAVGWDRGKLRALIRLRTYLLFLARVGKNTFHPSNLLILTGKQVMACVTDEQNRLTPRSTRTRRERRAG